ncbi:hypothetical protein KM92DES2_10391 [uncultured Desulfovibrio sp.]|uniref:Uncharacterized protein n=1 Tax=uncultured Desulfovibrio sp. TaxID=167968 RepID=A0A212J1L9_9BACT|nr:hypothetical protein KM92DES2_10391 [uncultured Desulfovibrio sp.]
MEWGLTIMGWGTRKLFRHEYFMPCKILRALRIGKHSDWVYALYRVMNEPANGPIFFATAEDVTHEKNRPDPCPDDEHLYAHRLWLQVHCRYEGLHYLHRHQEARYQSRK